MSTSGSFNEGVLSSLARRRAVRISVADLSLSGNSELPALTGRVAELPGFVPGRCTVKRFPDSETKVRLAAAANNWPIMSVAFLVPCWRHVSGLVPFRPL